MHTDGRGTHSLRAYRSLDPCHPHGTRRPILDTPHSTGLGQEAMSTALQALWGAAPLSLCCLIFGDLLKLSVRNIKLYTSVCSVAISHLIEFR